MSVGGLLQDAWDSVSEPIKHVCDALSFVTVLGTLFNMLPQATAVLSFLYLLLRIYESKTVQAIVVRRRAEKLMRAAWKADVAEPLSPAEQATLDALK